MESFDILWNHDKKIHYSLDKDIDVNSGRYLAKKVDIKNRHKRSQTVHNVAKEMALPFHKVPPAPSSPEIAAESTKNKIYNKIGIAFPPD